MLPRPALRPGLGDRLGDAAPVLALLQDRPAPPEALAPAGRLPPGLGGVGPEVRPPSRHQLGPGPARWLQEAGKKGGEQTGPSPVDRSKCGTALHLACDSRAMPLGVVVTKAAANDGCQTEDVLKAMVVQPPAPEVANANPDVRDLPRAVADGA